MAGACEEQDAGHGRAVLSQQMQVHRESRDTGRLEGKGFLNMLACHEIRNEAESHKADLDALAVDNARTIANLLRRAHEIHRQHGGIFGYDLEDWLQAEKELAEEHRATSGRGHSVPVEVEVTR